MIEGADDHSAKVQAAIAGDTAAVGHVLLAYRSRLLDYITRRLPGELRRLIDPLDILQDTQFRAARRFAAFRPDGDDAVYRWLVTIARHRMIELLEMHQAQKRGGGHTRGDSMDVLLEDLAVSSRTPSRSAAGHELMQTVTLCIKRLPTDYAEAIQLRHIDGLSPGEVAAKMGRSEGAIHMLLQRAMKTLRQELRSASRFL